MRRLVAMAQGFLAARFDPADKMGLPVTLGFGFLVVLAAGFGAVTEDVVTGDELVGLDDPISRFLLEHRQPWLTAVMGVVTYLGTAYVLIPLLAAAGLLARRRGGSWRPLGFLALTTTGASLTSTAIKLLVARKRPESGALVDALGYAFPSGHSAAAAAGWLSAALVLSCLTRSVALRVSLPAVAALVVVLVGVSRVYLGVHEPTDVLGGWALGSLWLTGTLIANHLIANRRSNNGDKDDAQGRSRSPAQQQELPE